MHLKLDDEILQVEHRIVDRKQQISRVGHATARRTIDVLASPVTLAGALALGFAVGGRFGRRREKPAERRAGDRTKLTSIAGLLMSGAMWFVRAQFGGPAGLAQFLVEKFQRGAARQRLN